MLMRRAKLVTSALHHLAPHTHTPPLHLFPPPLLVTAATGRARDPLGEYLFGDGDFDGTCSSRDAYLRDLRSIALAFGGHAADGKTDLK